MQGDYRNNHYVPIWYQKRFVPKDQIDNELYYLDLKPGLFRDPRGFIHQRKDFKRQGFRLCFTQNDLYTLSLHGIESREIEKIFFGSIDNNGRHAVEYIENFVHPNWNDTAINDLIFYMSVQKLRTPKGLGWIRGQVKVQDRNTVLAAMLEYQKIYCAIWTEAVWQIADASNSKTKFIISDHPITVYNRKYGPRSQKCRGCNDPDIRLNGTHTIFPLSLNKILILTNLSWVRNPYKSEVQMRPNPAFFRQAIFNFGAIQAQRVLTEQEVLEINFIIKNRALRHIAAAKKEWLYPEKSVSKSNWNQFGHGYLLMPDPRSVVYSGNIYIGYKDGTSTGFDEYGHRPWQQQFHHKDQNSDWNNFHRFQGEFARLFGPHRRGRAFNFMKLDNDRDSDEHHRHHLNQEKRRK